MNRPDEVRPDRPAGAKYDDAGSGSHRRQPAHPQEGCLSRRRESLPTRVEGLPALPAEYHAAVAEGLTSLGLALDAAALAAIEGHVRLLLAWTEAINLTAIREPVAVARSHVIDSLTALPWLRQLDADGLLDLGSGGGFPGIPLAVALPSWHELLVDSTGKKAAFLDAVVRAVGLHERVAVAPVRAEALALDRRHRGRWPVVTARAVGSLAELIELAFPLLSIGGALVAWKRGPLEAELASAQRVLDAIGGGAIRVVDASVAGLAGHRLAMVTKGGPTPAGYPRDPAERRRRPW